MIALVLSLMATFSGGTDILLPDGAKTTRLRVIVTVDGRSPEVAWCAFIDKLFDYFDRDGDGFLAKVEAERIFPLPLPGGREAKMDFAKLDTNGDGKGSCDEFATFYRAAGFTPVVIAIRPPTAESRRLADALFRHLDRDGNGTLSRAELEKAPSLLCRFDENEDEILTAAELLALESTDPLPPLTSTLKTAPAEGTTDATVFLTLAKTSIPPKFDGNLGAFRVTINTTDANNFRTAKGFYLAQFTAVLGSQPALAKVDLEGDANLQAVAAMFDAADRDGDGKLTAAELRAFLDLVELGVSCQAVIAVEDRGRNLFDLFDANHDGMLDWGELAQAARASAVLSLTRNAFPRQLRLSGSRGPVGSSFGPVPVPAMPAPKTAERVKAAHGPRWFQSMDRNGDGFVSAGEFIGPPKLFSKLDSNGDGRISADEARREYRGGP